MKLLDEQDLNQIKQLTQLRIEVTTLERDEKQYTIQVFENNQMIQQYETFQTTDQLINDVLITEQQTIRQLEKILKTHLLKIKRKHICE